MNSRTLSIEIPTFTHHNFKVPAYDEQRDRLNFLTTRIPLRLHRNRCRSIGYRKSRR